MSAAPRIDNGKHPLEPLNIMTVGWLPSDTPYGNLLLKGMNIVRRIDRVNLEVERVFGTYVHPSKQDINDPRQDILEHQFYQEEVVYWLRKTADELISLAYVIDEWKRTGSWPRAVQVDSIAGLNGMNLPWFHVHQIVCTFLMNGGRDGQERIGWESAVHG
jgi:hypothetical protein